MSDLRQQVRNHYEGQSLSPEKVQTLLLAGRVAAEDAEGKGDGHVAHSEDGGSGAKVLPFPTASQRRQHHSTIWAAAIAASVAILLAGAWWMQREHDAGAVSYAALPPRVIEFFTNKEEIVPAPQDKREVKDWLVKRGAPSGLEIPAALQKLESAACQVVDVQGQKAYMSCYWTKPGPERGLPELVHLLVSRAEDFHNQPKSGKPVVREQDGWSFATWAKGDILYTMATAAPKEKLEPFLTASHVMDDDRSRANFISFVPLKMSGW